MEIVRNLADIPLFTGLSQEQYEELAMIVTDQEFPRGQVIFSEGDPGVGFYILISGQVKIYKLSLDGKEQILHILGPGEPFAEAAVFHGRSFPAFAEVMQQSRVFFFPRDAFINLIRENPDLAMNMMASLSMRLKKFAMMIESLSLKEVPGRLASHLIFLSSQQDETTDLKLNFTKAQLASLLGTIPETLSRILKKMSRHGLIETSGQNIKLLDLDGLEDLASGELKL